MEVFYEVVSSKIGKRVIEKATEKKVRHKLLASSTEESEVPQLGYGEINDLLANIASTDTPDFAD